MKANVLITTLGSTWQVVPELLGFTNPGMVDLYAHHPRRAEIAKSREDARIDPVDEVWCVSTRGGPTDRAVADLLTWRDRVIGRKGSPCLRVWQAAGIRDLSSESDCRRMAECIYRLVLHASERVGDGQMIISLTGGRKTMSSDIQNAAVAFGCHALVHVIQNEKYTGPLRKFGPDDFTRPLSPELKDAITPLVAGRYERNPVVDEAADCPIRHEDYPIPFPNGCETVEIHVAGPDLVREVRARQETAGALYANNTHRLMYEERSANFLALYNLPPRRIRQLKSHHLGVLPENKEVELAWLQRLPKTELHCHLGGIADIPELIEIAACNQEAIALHHKALSGWLDHWKRKLDRNPGLQVDFKGLRKAVPGVPEPLCTAAFILLFEKQPDLLDALVFGRYQNEASFSSIGFEPYERLGDLQGSGLLQSEASIRAACRILAKKAQRHNIKYLEVRCSPINYVNGGLDADPVARIIDSELSSNMKCQFSIIFIASRHGAMSKVQEHIELAERLMAGDGSGFPNLRGFDLAGNEKAGSAAQMRDAFMPMMEKCLHFTIHAGEGEDVRGIWEAVYHLNAERIGHGLTLQDNADLLERFRDRNIALEMCPSSNLQIVGFQDNYLTSSRGLDVYPLRDYLDKGLRVTVNTDNPGVSRTDFTNELHRAARLTPGGLSIWEMLLLIRNGFKSAFCSRSLRQKMLREAESEILSLIQEGPNSWR